MKHRTAARIASVTVTLIVLSGALAAQGLGTPELARCKSLAQQVTIYRDEFGVAHAHGTTDAAAMFGAVYARAEDNFQEIEPYFYRAIGRSAEVDGEDALKWDILVRSAQIEKLSRDEYNTAPANIRAIAEAFADALNYYLHAHPAVHGQIMQHFEPWHVFAVYRAFDINLNIVARKLQGIKVLDSLVAAAQSPARRSPGEGSNMWVVGPKKTTSGHPMLFLNPHTAFLPIYEEHLLSDEGWNVTGMNGYGVIAVPVMGHNETIAWALTVNTPDLVDIYEEQFDLPAQPLQYRYGSGYKTAQQWTEKFRVKTSRGIQDHEIKLTATHHGPIIGSYNGKRLAARFAAFERGGLLQEWYGISKAHNFDEFKRAVAIQGLSYHNIMYADPSGNIFYIYNGAIPRRDPQFDWNRPLDGSNPATEWQGYYAVDDLPQVLNPESGWMLNTNSSPWAVTSSGNPEAAHFPKGFAPEPVNPRARASKRLLTSKDRFTFEDWKRMAFDTYFLAAEEDLPGMILEWEELAQKDAARAERLKGMIDGFRSWDRRSTVVSFQATWFVMWRERMYKSWAGSIAARPYQPDLTTWHGIQTLEGIRDDLIRDFGKTEVPWGQVNRHQRRDQRMGQSFSDSRPSLPDPGADGEMTGTIYSFQSVTVPGSRLRFGTAGSGYVSVVELTSPPHALSIMPYGTSGDVDSSHFFDQAPLYTKGEFRPAWFTLAEVKAHAASSYHPGEAGKESAPRR